MANLPEQNTYPAGVYQIEMTDPVVGGVDGISNIQARQLASRTRWLKGIADDVIDARNGRSTLAERMQGFDALSPESQNALLAGVKEALNTGGALSKEMQVLRGFDGMSVAAGILEAHSLAGLFSRHIETLRDRVLMQGAANLKNKHVIAGMALTKSDIRALHLSQTGTVGAGVSRAKIDGRIISLADDDYHVSVPTNESDQARSYFAFLVNTTGSAYGVQIAAAVPGNGLPLYRLDIPAGSMENNLSAVTLTDLRVIQSASSWFTNSSPFVTVAFPEILPNTDYNVAIEIESATDVAAVGVVQAYDRARNGFKVRITGSADNVVLRWTLLNPHYQ